MIIYIIRGSHYLWRKYSHQLMTLNIIHWPQIYFGHLMRKADSLEKVLYWERLKAGGEGRTEDEMVGWYHQLNGHDFEWAPGDGEGQRILACCSPWGREESDTTEQLNSRSIFLDLPLFVLTPKTMYRHCLILSKVIYHDPLLFNGLLILNF